MNIRDRVLDFLTRHEEASIEEIRAGSRLKTKKQVQGAIDRLRMNGHEITRVARGRFRLERTMTALLEEAVAFDGEVDASPPRAKIALASAFFEHWLTKELERKFANLQGMEDFPNLEVWVRKQVRQAVPGSVDRKLQLGYALGIIRFEVLQEIRNALKIRNRAVHQTKTLDSQEIERIERAVNDLREEGMHLIESRL